MNTVVVVENNNWFMKNLEKSLGLIWCVVVRKKTWNESLVSVMYSKVSFYSTQRKKGGLASRCGKRDSLILNMLNSSAFGH